MDDELKFAKGDRVVLTEEVEFSDHKSVGEDWLAPGTLGNVDQVFPQSLMVKFDGGHKVLVSRHVIRPVMVLKTEYTSRGFKYMGFDDDYGVGCTLQESSAATHGHIWLGPDEANPRYLIPNVGWKNVELPPDTVCDTRMHLNREQAEALIKELQYFVETGYLRAPPDEED